MSEELLIDAKLDNLGVVLDFVNAQLGSCPQKTKNQISIAVEEIFANIAHYAYEHATGGAVVRVAVDGDFFIEFEDTGAAYDPLSAKEPDTSLPAAEREIGGLGIFMVKNIMDSVEYRRESNKNILTMRKKMNEPLAKL